VLSILTRDAAAKASDILEHIFWELRQFAGLQERPDDQTLVVVRVCRTV
jgi:serine phosphatase RsbU (regulator of sigma subunit)